MRFESVYRWQVAKNILHLPTQANEPLLDIGTDRGEWLARVSGRLCVGIDIQPQTRTGPALIQGDALRLPFAGDSFGTIWLFDVIEHIDDHRGLLREANRVLKPGGQLWLSTTAREFSLFPGGAVQRRAERSWGHVRRGYEWADLYELLPAGLTPELSMDWNEPGFRTSYVFLHVLTMLSPAAANWLVQRVFSWDAARPTGQHGHRFMRLRKHVPTAG